MDKSTISQGSLSGPRFEGVLNLWAQAGGQHLFPIIGESMLPLIRSGDSVLVVHGSRGVRRGDVIVFRRMGSLTAHRVLRISDRNCERTVITKGDNAFQLDPPLRERDIVGRVLTIKRGERHIPLDTVFQRIWGWWLASSALVRASLNTRTRAFLAR